jgi:hypothetical protein
VRKPAAYRVQVDEKDTYGLDEPLPVRCSVVVADFQLKK